MGLTSAWRDARARRSAGARLLAAVLLGAAPIATAGPTNQFWPEVGLFVEVNEDVRLAFLASKSNALGVQHSGDASFGLYVDYLGFQQPLWLDELTPDRAKRSRLALRLGYEGTADRGGDRTRTRQWIGEVTARILPVKNTSFSNRSSFVYQDVERSATDWFYLNKSRLERNVKITRGILVSPFVSAEFAYRFGGGGGWGGSEYAVGVEWAPIPDRVVLELSLNRQEQHKPERASVNALGLSVGFYF